MVITWATPGTLRLASNTFSSVFCVRSSEAPCGSCTSAIM
jgi:hypothetical protein